MLMARRPRLYAATSEPGLPSHQLVSWVGKGGLEPPRLAAHAPKACASANSATPPRRPGFVTSRVWLSRASGEANTGQADASRQVSRNDALWVSRSRGRA